MKVKYTGRKYAVLAGVAILHGEIRDISKEQLDEAEKYHPGEFQQVGAPAVQSEPEPAADTQPESDPVKDDVPEVETPKVEVSDVNSPVDADRPSAGGHSTPRRRSK